MSHIIPRFAIKELKKTSVGKTRSIYEPNKVAQDGEKAYMLCQDCEERFSRYENYFAKTFFGPYLESGAHEFSYDERLMKFAISLSWRRLYGDLKACIEDVSEDENTIKILKKAERTMRRYLLEKESDVHDINTQLAFIGDVIGAPKEIARMNPNLVIHRCVGGLSARTEDDIFYTFTNLRGICILTKYNQDVNKNTSGAQYINIDGGVCYSDHQILDPIIEGELIRIVKDNNNASSQLAPIQKERIIQRIRKCDNIEESEMYKELEKDKLL